MRLLLTSGYHRKNIPAGRSISTLRMSHLEYHIQARSPTVEQTSVLVCCPPMFGRFLPMILLAKDLVCRGYDVTFLQVPLHKEQIEEIGASFVPLTGYADFTEAQLDLRWPERKTKAPGVEQSLFDLEHCLIGSIPAQHEGVQRALGLIKARNGGREVVLVNEGAFWGAVPTICGAGEFHPIGTVGIGVSALSLSSIDLAPFGMGLHPDRSPEGRERNRIMRKTFQEHTFGYVNALYHKTVRDIGAMGGSNNFFLDDDILQSNVFLQMCTQSAEYPRTDAPPNLRFAGGLPKTEDVWTSRPYWWDEIVMNAEIKKIVFVSQGPAALNYEDLIFPTMAGLKYHSDILLLVALGVRGASLPSNGAVPSNVRVHDYIPYDSILPYCDLFITNGGYGSFQHALRNGVPLVVAGVTEQNAEVAARAEWAGVAVNLKTSMPTPDAVAAAVNEVITNPMYTNRALEMQAEMGNHDPMTVVAETIDELAAGRGLKSGYF